jgi:hypothetical protein
MTQRNAILSNGIKQKVCIKWKKLVQNLTKKIFFCMIKIKSQGIEGETHGG